MPRALNAKLASIVNGWGLTAEAVLAFGVTTASAIDTMRQFASVVRALSTLDEGVLSVGPVCGIVEGHDHDAT
jgi:hypothetical protein